MSNEKLRGVGGWLAFLIISMMVLSPLLGLGRVAGDFAGQEHQYPALIDDPNWQGIKTKTWMVFFPAAAFMAYAGWNLWKRHVPGSVSLVKWSLWISAPGSTLLLMVLLGGEIVEQGTLALIPQIMIVSIWTAYLSFSRRVKNTYFTPSDSAQTITENRQVTVPLPITPPPTYQTPGPISPVTQSMIKTDPLLVMTEIDEEAIYETVAKEVESGNVRKGLWTKLWTQADGDDAKVKLAYIRTRVAELRGEEMRAQSLAANLLSKVDAPPMMCPYCEAMILPITNFCPVCSAHITR